VIDDGPADELDPSGSRGQPRSYPCSHTTSFPGSRRLHSSGRTVPSLLRDPSTHLGPRDALAGVKVKLTRPTQG
jgi:hypothetical protein